MPSSARTSSAVRSASCALAVWRKLPTITFSSTESLGNGRTTWKVRLTPSRASV